MEREGRKCGGFLQNFYFPLFLKFSNAAFQVLGAQLLFLLLLVSKLSCCNTRALFPQSKSSKSNRNEGIIYFVSTAQKKKLSAPCYQKRPKRGKKNRKRDSRVYAMRNSN